MLRVRDLMTPEVVTLGPDASAGRALGLCRENNIRHLPIVDGGRLVGLVSDRDLRDVSPPRDTADQENTLSWLRVRDMMTTELVTIHPLDTIDRATREVHDRRVGCLPVVADGELVGIVTSSDLVRILAELFGAFGVGSWVEVEVPNSPGALAGVTDTIRERQINIASVFLAPAQRASYRIHAADHRTPCCAWRARGSLGDCRGPGRRGIPGRRRQALRSKRAHDRRIVVRRATDLA